MAVTFDTTHRPMPWLNALASVREHAASRHLAQHAQMRLSGAHAVDPARLQYSWRLYTALSVADCTLHVARCLLYVAQYTPCGLAE